MTYSAGIAFKRSGQQFRRRTSDPIEVIQRELAISRGLPFVHLAAARTSSRGLDEITSFSGGTNLHSSSVPDHDLPDRERAIKSLAAPLIEYPA